MGALESQHAIRGRPLTEFSEQNLVDCSGDVRSYLSLKELSIAFQYGNNGCAGGWPHLAFNYVKDNKGIDTETAYPYDGEVKIIIYSLYI